MKGIKGFQVGHTHSPETKFKISKALSKKIEFNCDMCGESSQSSPSHYKKKKRHFCSSECYSRYRKEVMKPHEQNSYRGGGMSIEDKKIRVKARSDLNHAVRDGYIERLPCNICGDKESEAHHHDYSKPLDVEWLCDKHHHEAHSLIHQNKELLND